MEIREILENVRSGALDPETAEALLRKRPFEELGYAKLDSQRELRSGFPEVVFCQGKAPEHLQQIYLHLYEENGEVLGTRATAEQAHLVQEAFAAAAPSSPADSAKNSPAADALSASAVQYDPLSRILRVERPGKELAGHVVVCSAGTADLPVAEEAAQTAEFFGTRVDRVFDVGVSGIHRLLAHTETLQEANAIVAVAGMEGALASVIGGLVSCPVIAVPTSVGYGANFEGLSALLTMINSCANGIAVVNIDNGYGAGYLATQINRLAIKKEREAL